MTTPKDLTYRDLVAIICNPGIAAINAITFLRTIALGMTIMPPTFANAVNAWSMRRLNGELVPCILLDSTASAANRLEAVLAFLREAGRLRFPALIIDFTGHSDPVVLRLGRVASYQLPHRDADAAIRDSKLNGQPFRDSEPGRRLAAASTRNATALIELDPISALLGAWLSEKGGRGRALPRLFSQEIIGFNAEPACRVGSKSDPLGINTTIYIPDPTKHSDHTNWTADPEKALRDPKSGDPILYGTKLKKDSSSSDASDDKDDKRGGGAQKKPGRPSLVNHSAVTPDIDRFDGRKALKLGGGYEIEPGDPMGGVTIDHARHYCAMPLGQLRQMRFPANRPLSPADQEKRDIACRAVFAAFALAAWAGWRESGHYGSLRSGCDLVIDPEHHSEHHLHISLVGFSGDETRRVTLDNAITIFNEAVERAREVGIQWDPNGTVLTPTDTLCDAISRTAASVGDDTEPEIDATTT